MWSQMDGRAIIIFIMQVASLRKSSQSTNYVNLGTAGGGWRVLRVKLLNFSTLTAPTLLNPEGERSERD